MVQKYKCQGKGLQQLHNYLIWIDYFSSSPDRKIDPSKKVMSQYEALSLDKMKDSPRTSESNNEALATDDNFEAGLEKIRNMTPEEADAAEHEAYGKFIVAVEEAHEATCKALMAVRHFRAIKESRENYTRTELEKMCSHQTLEEAAEEATAKCDAAIRVLYAAERTAVKAKRLIVAIYKAREKRPMTGKSSFRCYTFSCTEEATAKCDAAIRMLYAAERSAVKAKRLIEAKYKAREKRPMTDCESGGAS